MEVILFANQKGGVGKSTLSITLARFLVLNNKKVAVIDLDPQRSAKILSDRDSFKENLKIDIFDTNNNQLLLEDIKELQDECYDYVIVDYRPELTNDLLSIMKRVNIVIIPVLPSQIDFDALAPIIDLIKDNQELLNKTKIIFNIFDRFDVEEIEAIKADAKKAKIKVLQGIQRRRAFKLKANQTVLESNNKQAKKEFIKLAKEILKG